MLSEDGGGTTMQQLKSTALAMTLAICGGLTVLSLLGSFVG